MVYEPMWECEWNGIGEVIDWVVFEASSLDGQAQRAGLNGDDDDAGTFAVGCKSSNLSRHCLVAFRLPPTLSLSFFS